ncbi:flippase [Epilithonimonas hominis]|uniref:flippase n=1 Tax=Epilithonimonas hominis TaxID=420404 RepID=UPI00289DA43B|nr:flippase [Epilithonimonas hominis]
MSSIKKNFIYSSILTVSNYLFPMIVFPYVSRVLGVANLGIYNFVDSIVNYFILLSMLGIGAVGIREIAKVKNNIEQSNHVFSSLVVLNTLTTLIALIIFCFSIYFVPKLYENKELMFIGIIKLVSNFLLIEWFYQGREKFKFITNRTIIVKIIYVILVFLLVKTKADLNTYYLITSLMISVNAILNCWYAKSFFIFSKETLRFFKFLKPSAILGLYTILTSLYTTFNVIYLGFVAGNVEVGYYTTATKIYTILLAFFSAFTNVMLPRMSSLLGERKIDEFKAFIIKSQDALLGFSVPICIIAIAFAPDIIQIIAGKGYEGAIVPMQIIIPLILIIGFEQIFVMQILMPLRRDRAILINSLIGAAVGIGSNVILVPLYKSIGSSIVWVMSEMVVFTLCQIFVYKYIKVGLPLKKICFNIIFYIPSFIISKYFIENSNLLSLYKLISGSVFIGFYFLLVQIFIIKNEFVLTLFLQVKQRIKNATNM